MVAERQRVERSWPDRSVNKHIPVDIVTSSCVRCGNDGGDGGLRLMRKLLLTIGLIFGTFVTIASAEEWSVEEFLSVEVRADPRLHVNH